MSDTENSSRKKGISSLTTVIVGGLIVFGASTFYTDLYKQPNIELNLLTPVTDENSTTEKIIVKNKGIASAANVRVTVNPELNIISYDIPFYAENITSRLENPRLLAVQAQRLAPGGVINIETISNSTKVNNTNYHIFTTYEQGSVEVVYTLLSKAGKIIPKAIESRSDLERNVLLTTIVYVLAISFTMPYIVRETTRWVNEKRRKRYRDNVKIMILDIKERFSPMNSDSDEYLQRMRRVKETMGEIYHQGKISESDYDMLNNLISDLTAEDTKNRSYDSDRNVRND